MVHPLLVSFIQNHAATSWSLGARNTAVLDAVLPAIEKLTFVLSLCLQSGRRAGFRYVWRALFKVRQPGTLALSIRRLSAMGTLQVTLLWYSLHLSVWEARVSGFCRDVVARKRCSLRAHCTCTSGKKEWAVLYRDVVAGRVHSTFTSGKKSGRYFLEMSSLEACLLGHTARLRMGRKEWAVVSRDNVDGKSHFYELPSAESSDSQKTCELTALDRFFWLLEHA